MTTEPEGDAGRHPGAAWTERIGTGTRLLAAAFLGSMLALSALIYWSDYRAELRKAEDLTRALTQAADEQINGSLRTIDLLLQHVGRYVGASAVSDRHPIYDSLDLQAKAFPEVRSLFVADSQGRALRSGEGESYAFDVSDRGYFVYQKSDFARNQVVIDGPVNDIDGTPEISLSRPIIGRDGAFRGVVVAVLEPGFFTDPLKAAGLEGQGTAILLNSNGVVLYHFPDSDKWVGRSIAEDRLVAEQLPKAKSGVYRTFGASDGIDQISAYRALTNYPLVVATGVPLARIQAAWWDATSYKIYVEAAFSLLMIYLASQLDKREQQRRRIAWDIARLNAELEQRVANRTYSLQAEITERIRAEADKDKLARALLQAKEGYQDLFEGAIEGILIHRDFKPLLVNESCALMFGYDSVAEMLALPSVLDLFAESERGRIEDTALRRLRGEDVPAIAEFEGRRRDGAPIWCLISGRQVEWDGTAAIQAAFMDITASKRAEAAMLAAKDEAEQASASKTRFLAAASHDLRQPVQALGLYINVLAHRSHDPETADIIERIRDSANALADLLNSLLDISRLEAGLVRAERNDIALAPLLERLWNEFAPIAEETGTSMSVVVSNLRVRTDATLLERILQNLIANAIRYTNSGKVLVGCRRRGAVVALQVWDTGRGIDENQFRAIFEEFYQIDNAERDRKQGLGLGLAIVRRLSTLLNHPLALRSQLGKGSMFEIRVPLAVGVPVAFEPRPMAPEHMPANRLVLIIDDEREVRDSLDLQIREWGLRTLTAASGPLAVAALSASGQRPDIIIVDYRLQDRETGIEAVSRLSDALGCRPPVILLTGDTKPARMREAQGSGFIVLHKPVKSDELYRALAGGLG